MTDSKTQKPTRIYQQRPEPKFGVSTDERGIQSMTEVRQSPFTHETILQMRKSPFVMEQLQRSRAADMRAHAAYMRSVRTEIEERYRVSGEAIFRRGDGKNGERLYREDKKSYELLRESMYW